MNRETLPIAKEKTISLTALFRNFSDESAHKTGIPEDTISFKEPDKESVVKLVVCSYYLNGINENNKGYVSLVFNCKVPLTFEMEPQYNLFCEIAVIDAAGNKNLVRTFTFPYDSASEIEDNLKPVYTINRYVARDTLLDDPDNLLPDDVLTLSIEINVQTFSLTDKSVDIESVINSSFQIEEDPEGSIIVLNLNSELANRFCDVSSVFRGLCNSPMLESRTGLARLHKDNKESFKNAARIIMGEKKITFQSFDEILDLYIFADKYDFQIVIRACRKFCRSIIHGGKYCFPPHFACKVSQLATDFDDHVLKEIVDKFRKNLPRECDIEDPNLDNVGCIFCLLEPPCLDLEIEEESDGDESEFNFYN